MPAIKTYAVTRSQRVVVTSTDPILAAQAADSFFQGDAISPEIGEIIGEAETSSLLIELEE